MKNVVKVDFASSGDEMWREINWVITFSLHRTGLDKFTRVAVRGAITMVKNSTSFSPLKCFGQQTNSTPENNEIPHGSNIAKLRICMFRSWQAVAPVWFHLTNGQQRDALWMWSNKQPSGTNNASDWKGPSVREKKFFRFMNDNQAYSTIAIELIKKIVYS